MELSNFTQRFDIGVLDLVEETLKNTSQKDVEYHEQFRKIAREASKQFPSTKKYNVNNLMDYYKLEKIDFEKNVHKEYTSKFPRIKKAYRILEENYKDGNLLDATIMAYESILKECNQYAGLAADYICIAIYFYLLNHPKVIII